MKNNSNDNMFDHLSSAFTAKENELFQGVILTEEQFQEVNKEALENLAKMVSERRKWDAADFAGFERQKDGNMRAVFRKVSKEKIIDG